MALRVLVTSDTHSCLFDTLPQQFRDELEAADAVIHAGDFGTEGFYHDFSTHCKTLYAVRGNNDFFSLPSDLVFTLEEVKIGLIHSDRAKGDRSNWLFYHFVDDSPKLIIFGHTHRPLWLEAGERTLLNPGSPTRNRGMGYNSFAVLTIDQAAFNIKFHKL